MTLIFFKYYCILLISLISLYTVGQIIYIKFFTSNIRTGTHLSIFLKLVIGLLATVITTSIIFTKGITINISFIALGLLLAYHTGVNINIPLKNLKRDNIRQLIKEIFPLIIIGTLLYFFKFIFIYSNTGFINIPHSDYIYYDKLSSYIAKTGIETIYIDYIYPSSTKPFPYHYFELWLNIAITSIFKSINLLNLVLITYTIGGITIWAGLCAISENFRRVSLTIKIASMLLLFLTGIYFGPNELWINQDIQVFVVSSLSYFKIFPIYIFLILSINFFIRNKPIIAIYSLLCLPLIYITTAPSVLTSLVLFLIIDVFFLNKNKKIFKHGLIAILIVFASIISFYLLSNINNIDHPKSTNAIEIAEYTKKVSNIIGGTTIKLIYIYIIYIIGTILLIKLKQITKNIHTYSYVYLVPLLLFTSLLSWATIYPLTDSVQLFTNISIPLLNIFFTCIILNTTNKLKALKSKIAFTLFCACIILSIYLGILRNIVDLYNGGSKYSSEYLKLVKAKTQGLNPIGGFIKHKSEYKTTFDTKSNFITLGQYLTTINPDLHPISLSIFDAAIEDNSTEIDKFKLDKASSFYKFVNKQRASKEFKTYSKSKIDFINSNNIQYIIASKNVIIDSWLQSKIKEEIIDSNSGERLLLLK